MSKHLDRISTYIWSKLTHYPDIERAQGHKKLRDHARIKAAWRDLEFDPVLWASRASSIVDSLDSDASASSDSDGDASSQWAEETDNPPKQASSNSGSILTPRSSGLDELRSLVSGLQKIIMSVDMKAAAVQEFRTRSLETDSPEFFVSPLARHFVQRVKDRFTNIDPLLAERLGQANWQRSEKLKRIASGEDTTIAMLGKPTSIGGSAFHDSALGTLFSTKASVPAVPRSVASHSSFASSMTGENKRGVLRVPPIPSLLQDGVSRVCTVCNKTRKDISNRISWK